MESVRADLLAGELTAPVFAPPGRGTFDAASRSEGLDSDEDGRSLLRVEGLADLEDGELFHFLGCLHDSGDDGLDFGFPSGDKVPVKELATV